MPIHNATTRFSDRVGDYVKYRPSYPVGVLETLRSECGLRRESKVADIGSGTGILTQLLLDAESLIFGVEPNKEMREAAEALLSSYANFKSVAGAAEATGLDDESVDLVVAGQAFHWFDSERCKVEFRRILCQGGWIALIWNERLVDVSPFSIGYESLLKKHATDYETVDHRNVGNADFDGFFGPGCWKSREYSNVQRFDFEGLKGRCLSSSYTPPPGTPECDALVDALRKLFDQNAMNGAVDFEYSAKVYYGQAAGMGDAAGCRGG